jgi:ABC-type lipoprotein release transport system permease subunit
VFLVVGSVLLAVAVIASGKPAIRAMRVDPSEVLRSD